MPAPAVTVVRTSAFDRHIGKYLTKPEIEAFQLYLAHNPAAGEPLNDEFPELLAVEWARDPLFTLSTSYLKALTRSICLPWSSAARKRSARANIERLRTF